MLFCYFSHIIGIRLAISKSKVDNQGKCNKNFSKQELEVTVEEMAARKRLLLGRLDNCGVTAETKKERMGEIGRV